MNTYNIKQVRKAVEFVDRHPKVMAYDMLDTVGLDNLLSHSIWRPELNEQFCFELVWVDPDKIAWGRLPFSTSGENAHIGVAGGNWDRFRMRWELNYIHQSIHKRYKEGAEWEMTPAYKYAKNAIERGKSRWHSTSTVEELDAKCEEVDQLYRQIKKEGYKKQSDLPEHKRQYIQLYGKTVPREITVAVGRNGELIRVNEGRHRLSIAKTLDLEKIPALVQIKHVRWEGEFDIEEEVVEITVDDLNPCYGFDI